MEVFWGGGGNFSLEVIVVRIRRKEPFYVPCSSFGVHKNRQPAVTAQSSARDFLCFDPAI